MATTTAQFPESIDPRMARLFFNEYSLIDRLYSQVFNVTPSTKAFEEDFKVAGFGGFRLKPEGSPVSYDDPVEGSRRRIVHQVFALGFRITMEMLDDDQHSVMSKMPEDLGRSGRDHQERLAWDLFNDAFAGNRHTNVDAIAMCANNQPLLKAGGTVSNELIPGVALSVAGLESIRVLADTTVDESNRFIPLTDLKTLLIHPAERSNAEVILQTEFRPGTSDNDINTMSSSRSGLAPFHVPFLTDTDAWFVLSSKRNHTIEYLERKSMDFGRSGDAETRDRKWDAIYRASIRVGTRHGIWGSQPP